MAQKLDLKTQREFVNENSKPSLSVLAVNGGDKVGDKKKKKKIQVLTFKMKQKDILNYKRHTYY